VLLFDKVLARIHNAKNKIQTITSFFGPKGWSVRICFCETT
jgi:hypothetical protein